MHMSAGRCTSMLCLYRLGSPVACPNPAPNIPDLLKQNKEILQTQTNEKHP